MKEAKRIRISKLDAVRGQLTTAIILYFTDGDPVSTHTLTTSALQLLTDLNKACNGSPMISDLKASSIIRPEKLSYVQKMFREPQNFFKHADADPKAVLNFNPDVTQGFILAAIEKYRELSGTHPKKMLAFSFWFRAHWPHIFMLPKEITENLKTVRSQFPRNNKTEFYSVFMAVYKEKVP